MELKGTVEDIIYHNEINSYSVCTIETEQDIVTAVRVFPIYKCRGYPYFAG